MKLNVFLKAVFFVVLVNYSAAAQEVLKAEADSIPVLEEWWRTDLAPTEGGGISYLPNFKDNHGAIAITTSSGDKTWMLRFPGDTQNVFTWEKGAAYNIQTGDFNGDGRQDYLDAFGTIYQSVPEGQLPLGQLFLKYRYNVVRANPIMQRLIADFNNDGFDDILISGMITLPRSVLILFGGNDIAKLKQVEINKPKLLDYYREHVIGVYPTQDNSWRVVSYWDNYSAKSKPQSGDGGFVLYRMSVIPDSDSARIEMSEIDRITEHSYNGENLYTTYLSSVYKSSYSKKAFLFAHKPNVTGKTVFSIINDKLEFLFKSNNNFGAILKSIDQDQHEDITGSYAGNLVIYSGGDFIDTVPKMKFFTCSNAVTAVSFGDINGDNVTDIAIFDDGNPSFELKGCFSVILGQTPSSISESHKSNQFSLKTFKTTSTHFTISFTLLKESHATFSLFDMEGKLVKVLKEGMFDAGEQSFIWDSGDVPQGAYLLQLTAGGKIATEKILIAK